MRHMARAQGTGSRRCAGLIAAALALTLAACSQSGGGDYPNVYGPGRAKPLSPGPGGGLWSPADLPPQKSSSAGYLFTYLPKPPPPPPPGSAVDTSNLLTPAQQAQSEAARTRRGAEAAEAMKRRLRREGRVAP